MMTGRWAWNLSQVTRPGAITVKNPLVRIKNDGL
jgi:hypothetical protein